MFDNESEIGIPDYRVPKYWQGLVIHINMKSPNLLNDKSVNI